MTVGNTSILFLVLLTFGALCGREVDSKRPLYVGALFELSDHWYASYVNFFINIVEYAFQQIENNTDILADYSLKLITKDTKVNTSSMLCLISEKSHFKEWHFVHICLWIMNLVTMCITIQDTSISITFFMLNSTNIPTIVVILTFMRRMNSVFECLKANQSLLCSISFL